VLIFRKGVNALRSRPATGHPRTLTLRRERQLFAWINGKDPRQHSLNFGLRTRAIIASLIEQKLAVKLGLAAGGELLAKLGLTPQKPLERSRPAMTSVVGTGHLQIGYLASLVA